MNTNAVLFLLVLFLSCTGTEKLASDISGDRLYFGKSGGFTNMSTEYVLFEKGQLFRVESGGLRRIGRASSKEMDKVDSLLGALNFENLDLNEPGNVTYHIKTIRSGVEKEVRWTDTTNHPLIKELYNILMATSKELL